MSFSFYTWVALLCTFASGCNRLRHERGNLPHVLASNLVVDGSDAPSGLHFTGNVATGRDYIVEIEGKLLSGQPTLRIDFGENNNGNFTYLYITNHGLKIRVRSKQRLSLLLYQDGPFEYLIENFSIRLAQSESDFFVPCIADPNLHGAVSRESESLSNGQVTGREDKGFDRYKGSPPLLFTSWEFVFLFLPIVLSVHRWLGYGKLAIGFVVIASFFWYSCWDWRFGPVIIVSITVNWLAGRSLQRRRRKGLLWAMLLFNILPLLYFKYTQFAFSAFGLNAGDWIPAAILPSILPLGISFYTFQKLAYIVDVYRGAPAESSLLRFSFFVLFFPQLVAGPITHHSQILPQLGKAPRDKESLFFLGCLYFLIGFIKKRLVADTFAAFVDPYYVHGGVHIISQAVVAAVGYALQLYFDFSGYSDMALGLGGMFGITLPWNFNSPYKSASFREFWQRWHITLSAFLRDYVYIPLGGNRVSPWRRYLNLFLTMLVGGIWHGAGWAFVIWGAGHGILLSLQHAIGERRWRQIPRVCTIIVVFASVTMLWIPFRAESLGLTAEVMRGFLHWQMPVWPTELTYCLIGALFVLLAPNSHYIAALLCRELSSAAPVVWEVSARLGLYVPLTVFCLTGSIVTYYSTAPDAWLRCHLPLAVERDVVDSSGGSLRTNIDRCAALSGPLSKWVIVGPSYAGQLGYFTWNDGARRISVGSTGIGGQSFASWIRIPMSLLKDPSVRRIYVACSPIGLSPPDSLEVDAPFSAEGVDQLKTLEIGGSQRVLSALGPTSIGVFAVAKDILTLRVKGQRYFQIDSLASDLTANLAMPAPEPLVLTRGDLENASKQLASFRSTSKRAPEAPNLANGNDAAFRWTHRNVVEGLKDGGKTSQVLGRFIDLAKAEGKQIVLYDTPTLKLNPAIYPIGFFDQYQRALKDFARRRGVPYIDLSGLFPEDRRCMADFCHPWPPFRQLIVKSLIAQTESLDRK